MQRVLCLIGLCLSAVMASESGGFLFVTFKGENEQIYAGLSQDGRRWGALNGANPILISQLGEKGVRDPFIMRSHDGAKTYILATDLAINLKPGWGRATTKGSKSIIIWESTNLVTWSEPRSVQVAADDAGCTWAPEAVYDEENKDYLVFWASQNQSDGFKKQRIWACRTKDFITVGKPFVYIDPPYSVIDTTITYSNGVYYRFSKNESRKAISMEVSAKLMGPWRTVETFSLGKMSGYEGPCLFQLPVTAANPLPTWCLLLDYYSKGQGYKPFITKDLASGAFAADGEFSFPYKFRHGTVMPITRSEYTRLVKTYGEPVFAK